MSTALLNSGSIDFLVEAVWNDALFAELEAAGQVSLPPARREDLQQLAFSWLERRSMSRAAYRPVRAMLERLRKAAAKGRTVPSSRPMPMQGLAFSRMPRKMALSNVAFIRCGRH